jgi:hypothetical protein
MPAKPDPPGTPLITWEQVFQWTDRAQDQAETLRLKAHEAIERIRDLLGDTLIDPNNEGEYHPILQLFSNAAPWTRLRLIWLTDTLALLQNSEGYHSVLGKLRRHQDFYEGVFALEVAECLRPCGLISFEKDTEKTLQRQPDLRVLFPEFTLHVELVTVGASIDNERAFETADAVFHALLAERLGAGCWAGRILRIHSTPRLRDTLEDIHLTADRARESGFAALELPSIIVLGLCIPEKLNLLESWAKAHELKLGSLEGPPSEDDDLRRVRARIREKANGGQLPANEPGIIVVRSSGIMGAHADPERVAMAIEEEAHPFPNIIAVVVLGSYWGGANGISAHVSDSVFSSAQRLGIEARQVMFIRNRYSEVPFSEAVLEDLEKGFTGEHRLLDKNHTMT